MNLILDRTGADRQWDFFEVNVSESDKYNQKYKDLAEEISLVNDEEFREMFPLIRSTISATEDE